MSRSKSVKLAILWHLHQPDYRNPLTKSLELPWVRLHATKDYLDMPLLATKYENVKVTFNLVPSLLDQLELYLQGGTDPHLELSRLKADSLTSNQKKEILSTFFPAAASTMIEPHPRFKELYDKFADNQRINKSINLISSDELRDLQVWSNLVWVDPIFKNDDPIKSLLKKQLLFSEDDKNALLSWQLDTIAKIIPTYQDLLNKNKIDVSFSPYYHPILPLLYDSNSAQESLPNINLPKHQYHHPEDAKWQIKSAQDKYEQIFKRPMKGMWPSEGSISNDIVSLASDVSLLWLASDEELLYNSLRKSGTDHDESSKYKIYNSNNIKLFFRDKALSDKIGFLYSSMSPEQAVDDFIHHIHAIRDNHQDDQSEPIISVILDGENAWEYFKNDGFDFLDLLYQRLSSDDSIQMVTFSELSESSDSKPIDNIQAGSWINGNFAIWIGHSEDNSAWDLLSETRKWLTEFEAKNKQIEPKLYSLAWRQIYIAEGSDWNWWYGEDHSSAQDKQFDKLYRSHLCAAYEILNQPPPTNLFQPIQQLFVDPKLVMPEKLLTPVIDGRLSHYYEWSGSGYVDSDYFSAAMHQGNKIFKRIYFAYDRKHIYIRLDFVDRKTLDLNDKHVKLTIESDSINEFHVPLTDLSSSNKNEFEYCFDEVLEIAVTRESILREGRGRLKILATLLEGDSILDSIPSGETLTLVVHPVNEELFWPS